MSHTTGPWVVDIDGRNIIGQGNGYPVVAKVKRDEDARLIASAPEMLEALKDIISTFDSVDMGVEQIMREMRDIARTAIAKVEGRK